MELGRRTALSAPAPRRRRTPTRLPGNYTITLTTTDGWGKFASTTRNVSLTEPAGNTAPVPTFTAACASFTTCAFNSTGTVDNQGDAIRYSWNFGDTGDEHLGEPVEDVRDAGHLHGRPDGHRRVGQVRHGQQNVTITEPASNNAPTAVIASGDVHDDQHDLRDERDREQ